MAIISYQGDQYSDTRGKVLFYNDFDLTEVVRLYEIYPNANQPRGWQAHSREKKWFYCKSGTVLVNLIKLDNFDRPSADLDPKLFRLSEDEPIILEVPGGYATAFMAVVPDANIMVFSNFSLKESQEDDYRFKIDTWTTLWQ